jgi:hypothetical protein
MAAPTGPLSGAELDAGEVLPQQPDDLGPAHACGRVRPQQVLVAGMVQSPNLVHHAGAPYDLRRVFFSLTTGTIIIRFGRAALPADLLAQGQPDRADAVAAPREITGNHRCAEIGELVVRARST